MTARHAPRASPSSTTAWATSPASPRRWSAAAPTCASRRAPPRCATPPPSCCPASAPSATRPRGSSSSGLGAAVLERIAAGTPFLGVCLGLQLLFESSGEGGRWPGLGVFARHRGAPARPASRCRTSAGTTWSGRPAGAGMARGLPAPATVYFVHSYAARPGRPRASSPRRPTTAGPSSRRWRATTSGRYSSIRRRARASGCPAGQLRRQRPPGGRHLMIVFPAVDIQGGKAVRLRRGDFDDVTVFGDDPVELARHWQDRGRRGAARRRPRRGAHRRARQLRDRRAHRQGARHPRAVRRRRAQARRLWRSSPASACTGSSWARPPSPRSTCSTTP